MPPNVTTVDVREDLRVGREPLPLIHAAVGGLGKGELLRVIAPFEPLPLIRLLATQGFSADVTKLADGDFAVLFTPN